MKNKLPKNSEKIKPLLLEFKTELAKIYKNNIKKSILFGSYARGVFHSESDIDLLVVLEKPENPYIEIERISDIKFNFLLKYNINISCLFSDEKKFQQRLEPVYYNIMKEGIII